MPTHDPVVKSKAKRVQPRRLPTNAGEPRKYLVQMLCHPSLDTAIAKAEQPLDVTPAARGRLSIDRAWVIAQGSVIVRVVYASSAGRGGADGEGPSCQWRYRQSIVTTTYPAGKIPPNPSRGASTARVTREEACAGHNLRPNGPLSSPPICALCRIVRVHVPSTAGAGRRCSPFTPQCWHGPPAARRVVGGASCCTVWTDTAGWVSLSLWLPP